VLFVNLSDQEWADMGIKNKFHIRKLQLIMPQYHKRYQLRQGRRERGEDINADSEDDISEYSPSELSDMIAQEGMSDEESEEEEDNKNVRGGVGGGIHISLQLHDT
jgi:hypothetical protein